MRLCCEPIRIFRFAALSFLSCIFFFVSAAFASSVYHNPHIVDSYACFALCEVGMIGGHMRCPVCGHPESKVVDSRPSDEFNSIRRRRECLKCGNRFTTYERLGDNPIIVVKSDGTTQVLIARSFIAALASRALNVQISRTKRKRKLSTTLKPSFVPQAALRSNRKILAISSLNICAVLMTLPISDSRASIKIFKLLKSSAKHSKAFSSELRFALYALHEQ